MHYFSCILSISFIWIAAFPCVILIIFFLILEMNVSFKLFSSFWRFASSSRTKKSKRGNNKHVMWSLLPPSLHSLGGCFRDDSKRRSINDNNTLPPTERRAPTERRVRDSLEWLLCALCRLRRSALLIGWYIPLRFLSQSDIFKDLHVKKVWKRSLVENKGILTFV